jgi:hypothetical protein
VFRCQPGKKPTGLDISTVIAFAVEGAAGCGKTFRLLEVLNETVTAILLPEDRRVLALTFMHGARRRLHEKLRRIAVLGGRFECMTIDAFAWRLVRRWRSLVAALGSGLPNEHEYDAQCDLAGALLERPEVRGWVVSSFPIIVIDEAQDLKVQRLRMVRALAQSARVLVAADEFQCLDPALRPNPLVEWLRVSCEPEVLTQVRRTDVPGLLAAAALIRSAGAPTARQGLKIFGAQGVPMAAAYLANGIAWREGGKVAIITPSLKGGFAQNVIQRVSLQACGLHGNGPYKIRWERSEDDEISSAIEALNLNPVSSVAATLAALELMPRSGLIRDTCTWVRYQARVAGKTEFTRAEIEVAITRQIGIRRHRYGADNHDFAAMTVQQAKNREFEGVFILWPYQVGGDAEHKRRLLYNAVTRAQRWCTIVAQGPQILEEPPFK